MRNYSTACERNEAVIFETLQPWLTPGNTLLEIGSGSGQHALYFCQRLPDITWQCSDRPMWLADLQANIDDMALNNVLNAIELDVNGTWPTANYDMIYTANSLHIMDWESVKMLFANLAAHLSEQGIFCCYGPMKYAGQFTSDSNANFDLWLKERDANSGIRDIEKLQALAEAENIELIKDIKMPANNQLLIWKKRS